VTTAERTRQSGNLPVSLTSFIGRRREVAEARALMCTCRMLTLCGAGGVGKTRLALQVATSARRAFRDGVWWVELADLTDPAMVPRAVAGAVGLRDEAVVPTARLAEHLADKQTMIVLDNCEHLPDACASLVGALLPRAGGLVVLATSRQRLGAEGEQIMHVEPFAVPESWSARRDGIEAVQLFVERARATDPGFELTEANRDTVLAICRKLDGVALAIELASVWVATLTPAQILARLSDRFALLTVGPRGARPRQRTLQAAIDWSFSLCSPAEQTLWSRLSVFTGGFDLEATEAVCSGPDVPREEILSLLAGLLDKSVVVRLERTHGARARYRLLETIRSYGLARLAASGQEQAVRTRHRDHYRRLAQCYEAECFGPHQVEWLLQLRRDHPNLRAAIEFCLRSGDGRTALEVAGPTYHWISSGYLREGLAWLDRALAMDDEPSAVRAKALWVRSFLAILLGERDAPERMLAECQVLAEQLDATNVFYPKVWQCSGLAAFLRGDVDRSRELFERALAGHLRAGPGHLHCAFDCMFQLALIALQRDEPTARQLTRRCLEFCDRHGALWSKSSALWLEAVYRWRRGDPDAALPLLRESLRLRQPVNDQTGDAFCIEAAAWCETANGRWTRAATLLGAAFAVLKETGACTSFDMMHRFAHAEVERQVRARLDPDAFTKAYTEGARCSPSEAVALVLPEPADARPEPDPAAGKDQRGVLTKREVQIAQLVAKGLSNRDIANTLVISQRTADTHIHHIMVKLGFTSRTQVARWVAERDAVRAHESS
jgi:predicted ATPase/DNA-binding CsgD family transcriptional regulator